MSIVKFFSMNCRGLGQFKKRKDVFSYLRGIEADIFMLQDVHCNDQKLVSFRNSWGKDVYISPGTNNARGVAILPGRNIQLDVLNEKHDDIGNVILIKAVINKTFEVLLMSVYGPNEDNPQFYRELSRMIDDMRDGEDALPVMLCGDLNIALDQRLDTYNYDRENNVGARDELEHVMRTQGLVDSFREINQTKKSYTWRKCNPSVKQARLDYILVSSDVLGNVQKVGIVPGYRTDHSAVYVDLVINQHKRGNGWFKFNTSLLKDKEYLSLMREAVYDVLELYCVPVYTRQFLIQDLGHTAQFQISHALLWEALILQLRTQTISYSINKCRNKNYIIYMYVFCIYNV